MSFFQNPFEFEFRGSLLGADRQYIQNFNIKSNRNRYDYMVAWNVEPYDLSSDTTLNFSYAFDLDFKNYATLSINVSGATPAATTATEVATALNANAVFSELFLASVDNSTRGGTNSGPPFRVKIVSKTRPKQSMRVYIHNTSAEKKLNFNKYAPVKELPSYFERYSLDNRFTYPELGSDRLVLLDVSDATDQGVITAAGLDYSSPTPDWSLLAGSSDAFHFTKKAFNGSNQLTSEIIYPAGAVAGDLAKKVIYTWVTTNNTEIMEIPYILTSGDLITPP